jgi:putative ATP-dependent endonuclease of OLD family
MRLSKLFIQNFRNFEKLEIDLGDNVVVVGENKIGKSNLVFALRLLLDPALPDTARQLRQEDFWDGLRLLDDGSQRAFTTDDRIVISADLADFEENESHLALLAEHLIAVDPMVSRITYVFQPLSGLEVTPATDADYEFFIYGGVRQESGVGYDLRKRLPLDVLHALRDAESDLANWRKSPLRSLLESAAAKIDPAELKQLTKDISDAATGITNSPSIKDLGKEVTTRLNEMAGAHQAVDVTLNLAPTDAGRLVRALRPYIDGGQRSISEASLGSANLLYLALKSLEFRHLTAQGQRDHTFLAIEEPEAHLHPHLQRLVYKDFLQARGQVDVDAQELKPDTTVLLTTHSPHIVSVAPLKSLVLLKKAAAGGSTIGVSTANIDLTQADVEDLERYLDVSRGELLFSRGVLFVEGDAECFLVPVLAKLNGFNLDELGISVCSVSGVNFLPYVKLAKALALPFAVMTDFDPVAGGGGLGPTRVEKLLAAVGSIPKKNEDDPTFYNRAETRGFFLNSHTFEIELFNSGRHNSMCDTIVELTENGAAKTRAAGWKAGPQTLEGKQLVKDIEEIGKGRYAQRLSSKIMKRSSKYCPDYILKALRHVTPTS